MKPKALLYCGVKKNPDAGHDDANPPTFPQKLLRPSRHDAQTQFSIQPAKTWKQRI